MDTKEKILAVAQHLADRVRTDKRPYLTLEWIVKCCAHQYAVSKSELMEAHFAAVNILKQADVKNAGRKPLSSISKADRALMRKQAKELAKEISRFLSDRTVEVTRSPIKTGKDGRSFVEIAMKSRFSTSFLHPTQEELAEWAAMDELQKTAAAYSFVQRYKGADWHIQDNIETIKAKLESSF